MVSTISWVAIWVSVRRRLPVGQQSGELRTKPTPECRPATSATELIPQAPMSTSGWPPKTRYSGVSSARATGSPVETPTRGVSHFSATSPGARPIRLDVSGRAIVSGHDQPPDYLSRPAA